MLCVLNSQPPELSLEGGYKPYHSAPHCTDGRVAWRRAKPLLSPRTLPSDGTPYDTHLEYVLDLRTHFKAPGGHQFPWRDRAVALGRTVAELERKYQEAHLGARAPSHVPALQPHH